MDFEEGLPKSLSLLNQDWLEGQVQKVSLF